MFETLSRIRSNLPKLTPSFDQSSRLKLVVWFSSIYLVAISIISFACATLLSNFITQNLLQRDARVAMDFVNSVVHAQDAVSSFTLEPPGPSSAEMRRFFEHIAHLPEVLRANVYGKDRKIIWSSDTVLIGQKFEDNNELDIALSGSLKSALVGNRFEHNEELEELEQAFGGDYKYEIEVLKRGEKKEHIFLPKDVDSFVENYLPVWSNDGTNVIGVVELYREPKQLINMIQSSNNYIWGGAAASGVLLFSALLFMLRFAMVGLERQEKLLLESERLAVIGEMASATAHSLRNPLSAIRSCAELALDDKLPTTALQPLKDIITQADKLESWIRSFLITSQEGSRKRVNPILLDTVIADCLDNFRPQLHSRGIQINLERTKECLAVIVDPAKLSQVINSIISNSVEAMPNGGQLTVRQFAKNQNAACIAIIDSGPGIPEEMISQVFKPFCTSKDKGLGIGLSLARRVIERMGGVLEVESKPGEGVTALLTVPVEGM